MLSQNQILEVLNQGGDVAYVRACQAIYRRQTQAEKSRSQTLSRNGVGFTGPDAKILSRVAVMANRGFPQLPPDLARARKAIPKYWRQLAEIAQENEMADNAAAEAYVAARVQAYGEFA